MPACQCHSASFQWGKILHMKQSPCGIAFKRIVIMRFQTSWRLRLPSMLMTPQTHLYAHMTNSWSRRMKFSFNNMSRIQLILRRHTVSKVSQHCSPSRLPCFLTVFRWNLAPKVTCFYRRLYVLSVENAFRFLRSASIIDSSSRFIFF